ncbi:MULTISPECIES: homoserine dehydrogenase [Brevibacillus]|jgi:Homoserine dehydrogenase|uniref:homoserine dehydrogenase n=1 Tax=Brevibacillus TaxID=55080 RepID=UPI000EBA9505|nr:MULTISPECIES: homoserine dehydrogenase [Brevibacillus]MBU8711595.1 homoserine dehydrogenase [Brevibacillus parabrevis]MDH6349779.1 homoserine dehydrogenase [Brevibacillus sp. 1238]MDR4999231.1 homoserine dehydrogenase [Brevibacillus parabrevis]MED2254211.1 homoserine dehydrogenase [Brevibacillus parabrevis]NRQ56631.1 homoserine dehydrogenase [Brevibacillus sp. HD1.4A]
MSAGVIKVGLLGLGTVGGGVIKTIRSQQEKLAQRLGKRIEIVKALVRDSEKERAVQVDPALLTTDFEDVLKSDVDIVVEVMGGVEPTYDYVRALIEKGCHVVTANKELLAKRGPELVDLANQHQVHLAYEASVAGGIPILSVLRQFLRTNDIQGVRGILNGTTNFILTKMEAEQLSYQEVLKQAQELGYAEADPRSDVEGFDAMYKLYILAQLVYGESLPLADVVRKGIADLSAGHIRIASELGYRIKLIAQAQKAEQGIRLSVQPTVLPIAHPLAQIQDAFNAVQLSGNIVGDLLFTGRGAGELPTASAVVEDLAYLLTQPFTPHPVWTEKNAAAQLEQGQDERVLCYLEGSCIAATPDRVLHFLREAGVNVTKLKVQFDLGGVLRAGLIVTGIRAEHEQVLKSDFGLSVRCFPLIESA